MTYEVIWSERALDQAAGFLKEDPAGLEQLLSTATSSPTILDRWAQPNTAHQTYGAFTWAGTASCTTSMTPSSQWS